jgi:hypothetical protein
MKISYNRNSMYAAITFLRENNPTAAKYEPLAILSMIEEFMMNCADDEETIYSGTMGFLVIKDDWNSEYAHFSIVVDPGVCKSYECVTIEYPCR